MTVTVNTTATSVYHKRLGLYSLGGIHQFMFVFSMVYWSIISSWLVICQHLFSLIIWKGLFQHKSFVFLIYTKRTMEWLPLNFLSIPPTSGLSDWWIRDRHMGYRWKLVLSHKTHVHNRYHHDKVVSGPGLIRYMILIPGDNMSCTTRLLRPRLDHWGWSSSQLDTDISVSTWTMTFALIYYYYVSTMPPIS